MFRRLDLLAAIKSQSIHKKESQITGYCEPRINGANRTLIVRS